MAVSATSTQAELVNAILANQHYRANNSTTEARELLNAIAVLLFMRPQSMNSASGGAAYSVEQLNAMRADAQSFVSSSSGQQSAFFQGVPR